MNHTTERGDSKKLEASLLELRDSTKRANFIRHTFKVMEKLFDIIFTLDSSQAQ